MPSASSSSGGGAGGAPPSRGRPSPRAGSSAAASGSGAAAGAPRGRAGNVRVVVRVRPLSDAELAGSEKSVLATGADRRTLQVVVQGPRGSTLSKPYRFHACLGPQVKQPDVGALCGIPKLLDAAVAGYHATVLTYGQTGSGKTYTLSGKEEVLAGEGYRGNNRDDGIITRAVQYLYHKTGAQRPRVAMAASYLEVYNEQIFDLLGPHDEPLPVRWDPHKGFHVPGLRKVECGTLEEMMALVSSGMRRRRVSSHALNKDSSRSHTMVVVHVRSSRAAKGQVTTRHGKVTFVDLAGSERLKASRSANENLKETGNINRSLFVLGKVIAALAEGGEIGTHIPYRDSKLTKLLMDSLGGSSLALMIACCSPAAKYIEETMTTLQYATRAKSITNQPVLKVDAEQQLVASLRHEIDVLRQENAYLRKQLGVGKNAPVNAGAAPLSAPSATSGRPAPNPWKVSLPALAQTPGRRHAKPHTASSAAPRPAAASRMAHSAGPGAAAARAQSSAGTQLVSNYAAENARLSKEVEQLRVKKQILELDHQDVMAENEKLRSKLEHLERVFVAGEADGGGPERPASPDVGLPAFPDVATGPGAAVAGRRGPEPQEAAATEAETETEEDVEEEEVAGPARPPLRQATAAPLRKGPAREAPPPAVKFQVPVEAAEEAREREGGGGERGGGRGATPRRLAEPVITVHKQFAAAEPASPVAAPPAPAPAPAAPLSPAATPAPIPVENGASPAQRGEGVIKRSSLMADLLGIGTAAPDAAPLAPEALPPAAAAASPGRKARPPPVLSPKQAKALPSSRKRAIAARQLKARQ